MTTYKYILFDHDGVLVDTEYWYFKAGERALNEIGLRLDLDQYLQDMAEGRGTWFRAREAGVDEQTIDRLRELRDAWYQEYLRTEAIGIEGVEETLAGLSQHVRMAIVTTSKRADFELIHERRQIVKFMDFVLVNLNPFHSFAARCSQRAARCKTAVKPHDSKGGNHLKTLQENGCVHARKSIR